jgi:hypothetical protein
MSLAQVVYLPHGITVKILKYCLGVLLWGYCEGMDRLRAVLDNRFAGKLTFMRYNRPNSRARATASVRRWTCSLP